MVNSLEYALEIWENNNQYKLYYNNEHVINSNVDASFIGFRPIEYFGYNYFEKWYKDELITLKAYRILKNYFDVKEEPLSKNSKIKIYSDGGCRVNTDKKGKWAYVAIDEEENILMEDFCEKENTTNSEMEILGLYNALLYATTHLNDMDVEIHCDSSYIVNSYNSWISTWKKKNWKKSNGQDVMYKDLMKKIDELRGDNIKVAWVRGHNGNKWNEYVDKLTKIED